MNWLHIGLAAAWLAASAAPADAVTCTVSATAAAFGTYNVFSGTPTDTSATIQTSCNAAVSIAVSYTLSLSAGNGSYSQRAMMNGPGTLRYNLFTNSARSTVWGDGTAGTSTETDGYLLAALTPVTRTYTAYGRIPAGQTTVIPGAFADALLVTLTY